MVTTNLIKAFNHVKEFFPTLEIVVFNRYGQWCYMDANFQPFNFSDVKIDDSLLENASDSIATLPFVYQPEIELED